MHFILMTMTTIGYGDITPKNPIEAVFTLFIMVKSRFSLNLLVDLFSSIWLYSKLH